MVLRSIFFTLILSVVTVSFSEAAYVTMARFDLNGDDEPEIVRTEGFAGNTKIKIYEVVYDSYFFKPIKEFEIPGNLVQVPEITDLNGDQLLDFYFATGSDIGIIYYDTIDEMYKRKNEINEELKPVLLGKILNDEKRLSLENKESDLYLEIEKNQDMFQSGKGTSSALKVQTL